jgi:phage terminase large subunit-like protein
MNVIEWAETNWRLPETGQTIVLAAWEKACLAAMFPLDGSPSKWETFLVSTAKKAGKTTINAIATCFAALTFPAPETAFIVANDFDQAQGRVFVLIADALRAMGLERDGSASIGATQIAFRETRSRIVALPADFAGAAGGIFGITSWTEAWAFRYESSVRLWEEMTPIPNRRSLRIVDSYAGFTGDAPVLEPLWQRALAGERLDPELPIYATGRLWAYLDQGEEAQRRAWRGTDAEMDAYYAEQRASLRPGTYARLHLNQWQSGEEAFITSEDWDACVVPGLTPIGPGSHEPLHVGIDAATKGDCAAVVAVVLDGGRVRLACHRIWTPRKGDPLDLEETVERYLLQLANLHTIETIRYDPFQMARSAATLKKAGLPLSEYPQTSGNLTAAGQNLYELIKSRGLAVYPDKELRDHAINAVAVDSGRGWKLSKEKASRKIDGLVALSFAALSAIAAAPEPAGAYVEPSASPYDALPALHLSPDRPAGWGGLGSVERSRRARRFGFGISH